MRIIHDVEMYMLISELLKHMRHIDRVIYRIENDTFAGSPGLPKYLKVEGEDKRSMSRPP